MQLTEDKRASVLIIDDEEQVRNLLSAVLGCNYHCLSVGSAEEALNALAGTTFDLVISDIDMGGMSGLELVPRVHSMSPDTVVLMVSGNQNIETAIEAMRAGAFDYITKPIDLRHVEAAVERALAQCRLLKERRRYKEQLERLLKERTAEVDRLAYYDTVTGCLIALCSRSLDAGCAIARSAGQTLGSSSSRRSI